MRWEQVCAFFQYIIIYSSNMISSVFDEHGHDERLTYCRMCTEDNCLACDWLIDRLSEWLDSFWLVQYNHNDKLITRSTRYNAYGYNVWIAFLLMIGAEIKKFYTLVYSQSVALYRWHHLTVDKNTYSNLFTHKICQENSSEHLQPAAELAPKM